MGEAGRPASQQPDGLLMSGDGSAGMPGGASFRLMDFNDVRYARGADAARFEVIVDGERAVLWMSKADIEANIEEWGEHADLLKALSYYGGSSKKRSPPPAPAAN